MQLHNYGSLWKNEANEKKSANFKPAKIFISDVFPAPDGPRMAVSWPDLKAPLIWCKILLAFFPRRAVHDYVTIKTLSDWLHLKLSIGDDLLSKYCFKVILFLVSRKKSILTKICGSLRAFLVSSVIEDATCRRRRKYVALLPFPMV